MIKKNIYYFNPGHEQAVLSGVIHYTPPAAAFKMMSDLALLPLWYGLKGDIVLVDTIEQLDIGYIPNEISPTVKPILPENVETFCKQNEYKATPWGLSPQSLNVFQRLKCDNLFIPEWKPIYRQLTHRKTAAECLTQLSELGVGIPTIPQFFDTFDDLASFIKKQQLPVLIKSPFSCSGRGLFWVKSDIDLLPPANQWIQGAIKKQKSVSAEPVYSKVLDFAMEFYATDNGDVSFEGYSVFDTHVGGPFSGCLLGSQVYILSKILAYVSEEELLFVQQNLQFVLRAKLGLHYQGHFGVDMMIYIKDDNYHIHPCVELNLRNTMGVVALELSKNVLSPNVIGKYVIVYDGVGKTLQNHQAMQIDYPLQIENGRIISGYFSLCPVDENTCYRAYIII